MQHARFKTMTLAAVMLALTACGPAEIGDPNEGGPEDGTGAFLDVGEGSSEVTSACGLSLTYFRTETGGGCPNSKWVCGRVSHSDSGTVYITITDPAGRSLTYSGAAYARACKCFASGSWRVRGWHSGKSDLTWRKTF